MASLSSLGEYPELLRSLFVNVERNNAGIYGVRFQVRGKPWIVTVDDYLLFKNTQSLTPQLMFADTSQNGKAVWPAIIEKAWAKVRGNYLNSDGGLI